MASLRSTISGLGLAAIVTDTINLGATIDKLSRVTGVAAENVRGLQLAFGNTDVANDALSDLVKNIGEAANSGGDLATSFGKVGVSINDLRTLSEKDILRKKINPANMEYLKYNERMWNKIYSPSLNYTYYLIQIADEDVNVIAPFTNSQNDIFAQNERFSLIRWGSQVDLVLPLDDRFDFKLCLDDAMHVNAGLDKLVKINFK